MAVDIQSPQPATPPSVSPRPKRAGDLADRVLAELGKDYLVIGTRRVQGWHAWLAFGLIVGLVTGVFLVANQSGRFSLSRAASNTVAVEAELGTLTGPVTIGNDVGASAGKFIQFGSATIPTSSPTPTPPPTSTPTPTRTPSPTPTRSPTPTPSPSPIPTPPVPSGGKGIWISAEELATKPMSGDAWTEVKKAADASWGAANIADQDSHHDVYTLAGAIVYARTGNSSYYTKTSNAIRSAINTENGGRTLALARNLLSYIIAADIIGMRDSDFVSWVRSVRDEQMSDGRSLRQMAALRPNNWGTHGRASMVAADLYLGDSADLATQVAMFQGFLGDRSKYASFKYGDLSWQCNPSAPVGVNPLGCMRDGHDIGGVIPDDQRRSGGFSWPPPCGIYPNGALDGTLAETAMLQRAGYPATSWSDKATLRATQWLRNNNCAPSGDNVWQNPVYDYLYGTNYHSSGSAASHGANLGWTAFTHGS